MTSSTLELRQVVDRALADRERTGSSASVSSPDAWSDVTTLGWHRIGLGPHVGGDGGGVSDVLAVVQALAAWSVSTPLIEHHLAAWALGEAGRGAITHDDALTLMVPPPPLDRTLPAVSVDRPTRRVNGTLPRVPWARKADRLALYVHHEGRDALAVVDVADPSVTIEHGENLAGEPRDTVHLDGTAVTADWLLPQPPTRAAVQLRAGLLTSAAIAGAIGRVHELAVGHARTREQFGRPLARLSPVATHLAEIGCERRLVEAALERARHAHERRLDRLIHTATARVVSTQAAGSVAERGHQVLGAIGITQEHPLHLSSLRLLSWRDEWGGQHQWARALGRYAVEFGPSEIWAVLTL